jgi:uncharacterized protein YkwD
MPILSSYRVIAALGLSLAAATALAAGQKTQTGLTSEQRAKVGKLLQEYRAAGSKAEKREEICDKVLEVSPAAATPMLAAVDRELQPKLKRYNVRFQAQAASAAKRKFGKVDLNEVVRLRKSVLDLQKLGDDFTHAVIVEKGDPAMAKLRAMFILDRGEVLDKSAELQAERKKLEETGRLWEKCQARMPATKPDGEKATPPSFDNYLRDQEDLASSMAIPQDPKTRSVLTMNAHLAEKIDPEEARAILALNLARNLLGLPALAIDLQLCAAARSHSADMEKLNFFSHESPVPDKKTPWDRAKLFGTTASAENIFVGSTSGKGAHEGWFHSPGHHRNQLGNYARVGVGRSGTRFTQMFGK